ncbi:PREDICTED: uncharacterized protein LOC109225467 isoform X2 [Nicotiana attenuata]|uniref:Transmembrane protein n=1 Tax=Nicotiana attenuata TaxID=49451 RepID=A0A1J6J0E1_NICAT|nr:PREDICTED: uncharacterized protein LOC109225467 isoform X2 [Nicotiana attenuata]OIT03367.1 hypothetical protein A4A49_01663 [Nicotiana attenuata]
MKAFGFFILFLVMGIAFVSFNCFSTGATSSVPGMSFQWQSNDMAMTIRSRKLQGNGFGPSTNEGDSSNLDLEDYRPIDPVPSTKASIRPGPVEHGTPLMPYIPKPSPPPISANDGLP